MVLLLEKLRGKKNVRGVDKETEEAIEINTDFFGAYKNISELRKIVKQWLKDVFSGVAIKNDDKGFVIEFNMEGFRKMTSGGGFKKLKSSYKIGSIIRKANMIHKEPDKKNRKDILKVYTFSCKVIYDGKEEDYKFIVRKQRNGKFLYDGYVDK